MPLADSRNTNIKEQNLFLIKFFSLIKKKSFCFGVCVCCDEGISYGSVHLGTVDPEASPGRMGQQFPCSSKSEGASQQKTDSKGLFFLRSLQVLWCVSAPITSIFYAFTVEGGLALAGRVRNDVFSLLKAAVQRTAHWNQQRG